MNKINSPKYSLFNVKYPTLKQKEVEPFQADLLIHSRTFKVFNFCCQIQALSSFVRTLIYNNFYHRIWVDVYNFSEMKYSRNVYDDKM